MFASSDRPVRASSEIFRFQSRNGILINHFWKEGLNSKNGEMTILTSFPILAEDFSILTIAKDKHQSIFMAYSVFFLSMQSKIFTLLRVNDLFNSLFVEMKAIFEKAITAKEINVTTFCRCGFVHFVSR